MFSSFFGSKKTPTNSEKVASKTSGFSVGDKVTTIFGEGEIHSIRADDIHVVNLYKWSLANGCKPILFMNAASLTLTLPKVEESNDPKSARVLEAIVSLKDNIVATFFDFNFKVGDRVTTIFGAGVITNIRDDGIHVVSLDKWDLANGCKPVLYMNAASIARPSPPSSSGAVSVTPAIVGFSAIGAGSLVAATTATFVVGDIVEVEGEKQKVHFVGEQVKCCFGEGVVTEIRADGIHVVSLHNWELANGCKPVLFVNAASIKPSTINLSPRSKDAFTSGFKVGDKVNTIFGDGNIVEIRAVDNIHVVHLGKWKLANDSKPVLFMNPAALVKITSRPPQGFKKGDRIKCSFGEGEIVDVRASDNIHIVTLYKWTLANNKSPRLYMQPEALTWIPKPVVNPINELYKEAIELSNKKKAKAQVDPSSMPAAACCIIN